MGEYLLINNTAGSATGLTTSDVAIQGGSANNLQPSSYKAYEITVNLEVAIPTAGVVQTITYKVKLGSTTIFSQTYKMGTVASLTAQTIPISLRYVSGYVNGVATGNVLNAGGAITVTQVSTTTDATTTTTVKNLYVKGFD